jgi:hypothetical protein
MSNEGLEGILLPLFSDLVLCKLMTRSVPTVKVNTRTDLLRKRLGEADHLRGPSQQGPVVYSGPEDGC